MRILDVKIADRKSDRDIGHHRAILLLKTDTGNISVRATADLSGDPAPGEIMESLIMDAVRQLKRLPEYRRGLKQIVVDENASVEFV